MDQRKALDLYPLPIARGYRRFLNAEGGRERHDAAYYLFEVYLKYLAAVAVAHYLAGAERDHRVNAALKGLARPSLGEWLRFLRECLTFLASAQDSDPALKAMAELLDRREARWPAVVRLENSLRAFTSGKRSEKESVSLDMLLGDLVAYRNQVLGHGAPRGAEHYAKFADLFGAAFPELLQESTFLTARRLVSFHALRIREGSRVECGVVEHMGLAPLKRAQPLVLQYGDAPPAEERLHLLSDEGKFVPLDPLVVAHGEDVFILNEVDGSPEYLSYSTGERHRPSGLGSAQKDLFERILGYRVDESRVSRMGDDLTPADAAAAISGEGEARRLGDYRIVRELGRGAMGIVFEAVQESLGRRVALKVLPGNFALDPRRLERFRREARATAKIHHPSIVPVYEVGEAEGNHFYAMEFIAGTSLDQVLAEARKQLGVETDKDKKKRGSSSTSDPGYIASSVERMAELCEGLEGAHALGLIHRDVKPSNILVDRDGRYVLVDFGLVHETEAQTLTRSGEMVGTLAYMSPEQVSRGQVDARADVYSLGVTLYEVLTLRTPYQGESDHEIQRAILFEEPIPPRRLNPRMHRDLETVLLKALEKNPERRYASAKALAGDLRRFLRYEPIHARPQGAWTRITRRAAKHKAGVVAVGAISVLLLTLGVVLLWNYRQEQLRRIADYEPTVLQAAVKLQLGGLSLKRGAGYLSFFDAPTYLCRGDLDVLSSELGRMPIERAVEELAAAAAAVSDRPDAYYLRARGLLLLGREAEALKEIEIALDRNRRFVPALILRSSLREKAGDAAGAKSDREAASDAGAEGWGTTWLSAQQALAAGQWDDAAREYGNLIQIEEGGQKLYPASLIEAFLGRGVAHLEAEELLEAALDFRAASELAQDSPQAAMLLAKTYFLTGKKGKASQVIQALMTRSQARDDIALEAAGFWLAFGELEEKGQEKALEWIEAMREGSSRRERNRGNILRLLGRIQESIDAGERAIQLDPGDAVAHSRLAEAYVRHGERNKGLQMAEIALKLAPTSFLVHWTFWDPQWTPAERIKYSRKAIELEEKFAWAHARLGEELYFSLGEHVDGFAEVRKAIDLEPKCYAFHQLLGRMLEAEEKIGEAAQNYCRSIELNPTFPWAHENLFAMLRRKEKHPEIAPALDRLVAKLEKLLVWGADDTALIQKTLALVLIYHPTEPEPRRALRYARQAVEASGSKDLDLLQTLAEIQALAEKR